MKSSDSPSTKIFEFDILRALAITMLMFHHSEVYGYKVFDTTLEIISPYIEAILLGIFFFIAGYFVQRYFQKHHQGSVSFLFSRMLRIIPPYWLALSLYMLILGFSLRKRDLAIYLLGAHFVFAPNFVKPIITIWYVGAIVLFYVIFGVLLARISSTKGLLLGSALIFGIAYALHQWVGLIDERFYKYFIVFLIGILFARPGSLSHWLSGEQVWMKFALALISSFIFSLVIGSNSMSPFYILGVVFFIITWVILLFALASGIKSQSILKLAGVVSYASFFVYLLHRPLWSWLAGIFSVETSRYLPFFKMIPASIVVFILSYYLQFGYDRLLAVFRQSK